ncbi:TetR family transcriptional regulator [Streptomyces sp. AcH 505]|uniref:TetR/AcrR family transcriptional regulator n=1 Tax=unclassified Streptomyces TaxID=2593676 RepID=UPI000591B799|nr:TetR/AcrR family transcriptional regulator [Streptomyces sp. NBC_00370]KIF67843.1 TetR family transcriptional regulator [Streptomyces sp. AcH 505]
MTSFQRARSEEQRAVRRQAILDTAAAMLTEMPVAQLSLNELSRRVGLAKSNVLRYFESREAVLLDLMNEATRTWLDGFEAEVATAVDAKAEPYERADQLAAALAASLAEHPVLCDLIGAQASVLERNVSPEATAEYKRAAVANVLDLVRLVGRLLPELDEADATRFTTAAVMMTGAVWSHAHPSAAVLTVYERDAELGALRMDFTATLTDVCQTLLSGLLVRATRRATA